MHEKFNEQFPRIYDARWCENQCSMLQRKTDTTAFIEVAKATVIFDKEIKFVKAKVKYERSRTESGNQQHYVIGDCTGQSGSEFLVPNITINEVDRNVTIPIHVEERQTNSRNE